MTMVLYFLIVLGFAVTLHELGHFLVAKWSGVKVERFSLGFGPKLVGFRRGDTEYVIAPIPFGGYVKMAGDSPEEGAGDRPGDFFAASPWKRIGIVLAGPGMNFLLGFVIFFFIAYFPGAQVLRVAKVGDVLPGSLAAEAGVEVSDRIVALDGKVVKSWEDLVQGFLETVEAEKSTLELQVQREEKLLELTVDLGPLSKEYPPLIGYVEPDSPAEAAGLEAGGRIVRVGDRAVKTWREMAEAMSGRFEEDDEGALHGLPTQIVWERSDGEELTVTAVPEVETEGRVRAVFGIARFRIFEAKSYIDYVWPAVPDLGVRAWINPVVGEVKKRSPAWEQGIRPGDLILAINGEPVDHWYQMARKTYESFHRVAESGDGDREADEDTIEADPVTLTWMKPDGSHHTQTILPEVEWVPDRKGKRVEFAVIGIGPRMDRSRMSLTDSAVYAFERVRDYVILFVTILRGVVSGAVSPKAIGGPIAIAQISGERGAWGLESLFNLIAMLSVSFAVINLVPIPVLDGGHFLVYLVEGIRRKRLTLRQMELVQKLGLAILIPIIGFIFYNDLARYLPFQRIADLFKSIFQ